MKKSSIDSNNDLQSMKAIVIYPQLREHLKNGIDPVYRLGEGVGLAHAIHLNVVHAQAMQVRAITPSTLLGKGQVADLAALVTAQEAGLVIIDGTLTPVQQRNLERALKAKVIDRTGLILEIFGERAQTAEGSLQVELAALNYQKSRLVRSWTHLERQRGGLGYIGGPGETQLEMDRRMIAERISRIERDLERVAKRRQLQRRARQKVPYPVVALVGYTNAGKSTLFNYLTKAQVFAEDLLFATLDPTMRLLKLPSGRQVILSDTVGFISDLPTLLVAAFRATLEEVQQAAIILHVRDMTHPQSSIQAADVYKVLQELNIDVDHRPLIEALNKIDLLEPDLQQQLLSDNQKKCLSALTGAGVPALLHAIDKILAKEDHLYKITLRVDQGKELAWLHAHGHVVSQKQKHEHLDLRVRLSEAHHSQFQKRFLQQKNTSTE